MAKSLLAAAILFCLAMAGLFIERQSITIAKEAEAGRYRMRVEGSRTRLSAIALHVDTATGKTMRSMIQNQQAQPWLGIEEQEDEKLPDSGAGRYEVEMAYVGDNVGQELLGTVRVDTLTGKSWYLQIEPNQRRWRWAAMKE